MWDTPTILMFSTQAGQKASCQTFNLIEQRNLSGYTGAPALSGFFQVLHVARGSGESTSTVSRAPRRSHESGYYTRRAGQAHRRALTQQQNVNLLIWAKMNQRSAARALQSYLQQVRGTHVSEKRVGWWSSILKWDLLSQLSLTGITREHQTSQVATGALFSLNVRACWHSAHVTDVTGSGDAVNVMPPAKPSGMTGLALGLGRYILGRSCGPTRHSQQYPDLLFGIRVTFSGWVSGFMQAQWVLAIDCMATDCPGARWCLIQVWEEIRQTPPADSLGACSYAVGLTDESHDESQW